MTKSSDKVNTFVFPGDIITDVAPVKHTIMMGPGVRPFENHKHLQITKAGTLRFKAPNIYWVDGKQTRYIPRKGDLVVGIVVKKAGDVFRIDLGSCELASLSSLAFEGATKKQKPNLVVGDIVYARVLTAHREMEPDLVCVDSYYKAGKLGPLSGGFLINVSLELANRLLNIENPLLRTLGKKYVYEVAVGTNGKVWINAHKAKEILDIVHALMACENQSDVHVSNICRQYM